MFKNSEDEITTIQVSDIGGGGVGMSDPNSPSGTGEVFNLYTGNSATGAYSHAEGSESQAYGLGAHAEGASCVASGNGAHAEGLSTSAIGNGAHAEGLSTTAKGNYSHAEGNQTTANGKYSHAEGSGTTANGDYSHAQNTHTTTSGDSETAIGRYNKTNSTTSYTSTNIGLSMGNGDSKVSRGNAFEVLFNGTVKGDMSYTTPASDYAEMFEWADGNPDGEDRVGYFVTLKGKKIKKATSTDKYIVGVLTIVLFSNKNYLFF